MKKLISLLSIPLIISCASQKTVLRTNDIKKQADTLCIEKPNPLDTIIGQRAYDASKELYRKASELYYSGDTISSLDYFKKSARILSNSNLTNEDWLSLQIHKEKETSIMNESNENIKYLEENDIEYKTGVDFTKKVEMWKEYYDGKGKAWFNDVLSRTPDYFPYIDSLLAANNIDPFVKWMYPVESGMKPIIRSHVGAAGISQFMRGTAKDYDLEIYGAWYDERLDAKKSIDASIQYMSKLYSLFNDPFLCIAAYNSGENGIMRRLKSSGSTSYDDLLEARIIPRETREHLPKIYAFMELANKRGLPEKSKNKTIENILKNNFDIVTVYKETDIDIIAKTLGITEKTLREYNTAYQMPSTPPKEMVKGEYSFDFRIPKGSGIGFEEKIALVKKRVKNPYKYYTVKNGNTLGGIGKKFGVNYKRIMSANGIKNTKGLKIGQRLRIPRY